MINIEILYPEVANLYGDLFNAYLLQRSYPDLIQITETHLNSEPSFPREDVDFIFMGACPERYQEMSIDLLRPHLPALRDFIQMGKPALFTGNSLEIFGSYIENDDGTQIPALGLHDGYAVRRMMNRYNSMYLGEFSETGLEIVGFKSQFSKTYGLADNQHLFHTLREMDAENSSMDEGLRLNNLMGTYLTGPFLIMNPLFAKHILGLLGIQNPTLAHEEVLVYAYSKRLEEAQNPATNFAV